MAWTSVIICATLLSLLTISIARPPTLNLNDAAIKSRADKIAAAVCETGSSMEKVNAARRCMKLPDEVESILVKCRRNGGDSEGPPIGMICHMLTGRRGPGALGALGAPGAPQPGKNGFHQCIHDQI